MTAKRATPTGGGGTLGTPEGFPVTSPPGFQAAQHDWVLQTVMELQKSTGQLTQAVNTLTELTKEHGKKIDSISHRITAAAAGFAVAGAILYFFLDRMWGQIISALARLPPIKP